MALDGEERDSSHGEVEESKREDESQMEKEAQFMMRKEAEECTSLEITDDDFGPEVDFTKREGFVYDPVKAVFSPDEVNVKRRPWKIQDVRSFLYLRRLGSSCIVVLGVERKHEKLVHGLAAVRALTPKQILKEESGSSRDA